MKSAVVISTILCSGLLIGGNTYSSSSTFAPNEVVNQNITAKEVVSLTKEDALNLLLDYNDLTYIYQGDESGFEYLQQKGLQGYVYLPDIDTDIGYFVDKNTQQIYYFNPGGYLELVK